MKTQFLQNIPAVSEAEQQLLQDSHVLVLGCGGLGGAIIENLVRLGVGEITAADGDRFEESNLNRQILATRDSLGMNKALAAKCRAEAINPHVCFTAVEQFFTLDNADSLLVGKSLVLDALDNIGSRLLLEEKCAEKGIFIIHGAVQGWTAQVAVVRPGSGLLSRLYAGKDEGGDKSCLAFTPAFCAGLQCAEAVKLICGRAQEADTGLFMADLRHMEFEKFDF